MLKYDGLCIGSASVDHFLHLEQPISSIRAGDKILVKGLESHSGGGASNAAAGLSKLGLKVRTLVKLGMDHEADYVLKDLKNRGIKNITLHKSKKSTNSSTIITEKKDRIIFAHKGSSLDLNKSDYKKSQLNAKWFYLASLTGKSFSVAKDLAQCDKPILFNPSLYLAKRGKKYLSAVLRCTNVIILNKEEAEVLLGKKQGIHSMLHGLHKLGPKMVIITNGPKRLYGLHDKIYSLMPLPVKKINTAGAGDAFNSGFLAGLIKGLPFSEAMKVGQVNSSSVIQHMGTKHKLLTWSEALKAAKKIKVKVL